MNRIRSAVDVYQENIHLRKELETMNEKFSKLKTENTELSIRYNYFKIVPDKFLGTNIDTLSKDRMYEYKSKIKKALNEYYMKMKSSKLLLQVDEQKL